MTELTRFEVAELAPLGSSDVFKTQAERLAELRRMRTIATLLLVLMAAIYLAMRRAPADSGPPISARSRKLAWRGPAPIGSPWSRFFAVLSDCQFLTRLSFPKTNVA